MRSSQNSLPLIRRITELYLCTALLLCQGLHAETILHAGNIEVILKQFGYAVEEQCLSSDAQGQCWARSVTASLSQQKLFHILHQVSQHAHSSGETEINPAALHLYLEYSTAGPSGAVPIEHLNRSLARLLQGTVLTLTPLSTHSEGLQILLQSREFKAGGSVETTTAVYSPDNLNELNLILQALDQADVSLLTVPGSDQQPGHVQPILSIQKREHSSQAALPHKLELTEITAATTRSFEIAELSAWNSPSYLSSSGYFGGRSRQKVDTLYTSEAHNRVVLDQNEQIRKTRSQHAQKYRIHQDTETYKSRICSLLQGSCLAVASGVIILYRQAAHNFLEASWQSAVLPNMHLIARLDGMGTIGEIPRSQSNSELTKLIDESVDSAWKTAIQPALNQLSQYASSTVETIRQNELASSVAAYILSGGSLILLPSGRTTDQPTECYQEAVCKGEGRNKLCKSKTICRTI